MKSITKGQVLKFSILECDNLMADKCQTDIEYLERFYQTIRDSIFLYRGEEILISEKAARELGKILSDDGFEYNFEDIDRFDIEILRDLSKLGCLFLRKF